MIGRNKTRRYDRVRTRDHDNITITTNARDNSAISVREIEKRARARERTCRRDTIARYTAI